MLMGKIFVIIRVFLNDTLLWIENIYLQTLLEECKYVIKKYY